MVCLEVFPGTWEPDPFLHVFVFFLIGNDLLFLLQEVDTGPGQPPTPQDRQITNGPQTWQQGLSAYWSIRSQCLLVTRIL